MNGAADRDLFDTNALRGGFACFVRDLSGEDAGDSMEGLVYMHAVGVDGELADAAVLLGTAHFEHRDAAPHFAECFDVAEQDDGVGDAGVMGFGDGGATEKRGRRK